MTTTRKLTTNQNAVLTVVDAHDPRGLWLDEIVHETGLPVFRAEAAVRTLADSRRVIVADDGRVYSRKALVR